MKYLLLKHEGVNYDPQDPREKPGMAAHGYNPTWWGGRDKDPRDLMQPFETISEVHMQ